MTITQQSPTQVRKRKMSAMSRIFQGVIRVMSGKRIRVILSNDGPPFAGWTDGQDVYLNANMIEQLLEDPKFNDLDFFELVLSLWGVCYHELSHILHSPRTDDASSVAAKARQLAHDNQDIAWWYSYNALEDQRIETWWSALYRPTKKFFEAMTLKWLMNNSDQVSKIHVLTHGRRYLPPSMRQRIRAMFVARFGESLALEAEHIIDDYIDCVFPRDDVKGWICVEKFYRIIQAVMPPSTGGLVPQPSEDNDPRGTQGTPARYQEWTITKGRNTTTQQEEAKEAAQEAQDKEADEADESDAPPKPQKKSDGESILDNYHKGDDQDEDDDDFEGNAEDADSHGDSNTGQGIEAESTPEDEGSPSLEAGTEAGKMSEPDLKAAEDELLRAAQEALDDAVDEIAEDVDNTIDNIYDQMRHDDGLGGNMGTVSAEHDVEPVTSQTSRKVVEEINRLRLDLEPVRVLDQPSGRLNMRRALTAQEQDINVFEVMDNQGDEIGGIEVVISIDLSGSMSGRMGLVSRIMWALKRAFDTQNIRCTVLGFETDWCVLYRPSEKAAESKYSIFGSGGGTAPWECMREATAILMRSEQHNRVMVTVTDGAWSIDESKMRRLMDGFHAQDGSDSLLVGLNGATKRGSIHSHNNAKDINNIEELPGAVLELVESMLRRAMQQKIMPL
jgi:Mg-chelatase subunit ChlD